MERQEEDLKYYVEIDFDPNEDLEEEILFRGYKRDSNRNILYWLVVVCTLGIFWLITYWYPKVKLNFAYKHVSINDADYICGKVCFFSSYSINISN